MNDPIDNDKEEKVIEIYWKVQPRTSWTAGFTRGVILALLMLLAAILILVLLTSISPYR